METNAKVRNTDSVGKQLVFPWYENLSIQEKTDKWFEIIGEFKEANISGGWKKR